MLGNHIGPIINYKLKILPLPFIVESTNPNDFKRIFKFDCAVPNTTIKYEIIDYPCTQDKTTTPTTVYTNNQELTVIRPKKIKLIASKPGYKDSNIVTSDLFFSPNLEFAFNHKVEPPYIKDGTIRPSKIFLYKNNDVNYDYYAECNNTNTRLPTLSCTFQHRTGSNKFNVGHQVLNRIDISIDDAYVNNKINAPVFTQILSVFTSIPETPSLGYLKGPSYILKNLKPKFPKVTITQSFTGRPALVTITKGYETSSTPPAASVYNTLFKSLSTDSISNGKIYYTTDGTDPTSASTLYTTPFLLNNNATIKAISISDNYDGTIMAYYVNVGEVHLIKNIINNSLMMSYTTTPNVSALTILSVGGGDQSITTETYTGGTNTYTYYAWAGTSHVGSNAGLARIYTRQINTTTTFYITAGTDYSSPSFNKVRDTTITDSNSSKLVANVWSGNMDNAFVTTYTLSVMKLAPIINAIWNKQPDTNYKYDNYVKTELFNYNINDTISGYSPVRIRDLVQTQNYVTSTKPDTTINSVSLKDFNKPGIYLIEHYNN